MTLILLIKYTRLHKIIYIYIDHRSHTGLYLGVYQPGPFQR